MGWKIVTATLWLICQVDSAIDWKENQLTKRVKYQSELTELKASFLCSKTGKALYDEKTKLWCTGPAYIAELYMEELKKSEYKMWVWTYIRIVRRGKSWWERRERSHQLISKIVISEPQEKDGTENYRSLEPSKEVPAPINKKIYQNLIYFNFFKDHFEPIFSHKRHKASNSLISSRSSAK